MNDKEIDKNEVYLDGFETSRSIIVVDYSFEENEVTENDDLDSRRNQAGNETTNKLEKVSSRHSKRLKRKQLEALGQDLPEEVLDELPEEYNEDELNEMEEVAVVPEKKLSRKAKRLKRKQFLENNSNGMEKLESESGQIVKQDSKLGRRSKRLTRKTDATDGKDLFEDEFEQIPVRDEDEEDIALYLEERRRELSEKDNNLKLFLQEKTDQLNSSKQPAQQQVKINGMKLPKGVMAPPKNATKLLLIFDVNKVLVHRNKGCSMFTPRPYLIEFLKEISNHFTIAVWTSMTKGAGRKVVRELFVENGIPLLFMWFQSHCRIIPNPDPDEKPSFFKDLSRVWKSYSIYNSQNTVRMKKNRYRLSSFD